MPTSSFPFQIALTVEIETPLPYFFASLVVHLILSIISLYVINHIIENEGTSLIRLFGILSVIYLIFVYFYPSIVAFDFIQQYKEQNIPTLKHPNRWVIFFLNLFLGITGIAWIFVYIWSHKPGSVVVEIVTFEKIQDVSKATSNDNIQTAKEANEEIGVSVSTKKDSVESRLITLNELKEKGIITEEEFNEKKEEILKSL